jgi:hypothetical protein
MRTRSKGGKDVVLQKKRLLMPKWFDMSWRNYTTLSSEMHAIEHELARLLKKAMDQLELYEGASSRLKAEIEAVQADKWGNGRPFVMPHKEFAKLKTDVPVPTFDWKKVLSRAVLRMYHIDTTSPSGVDKGGANTRVKKGQEGARKRAREGKAAYTLDDLEDQGITAEELGADTQVTFKEPQKNQQQQGKSKRQIRRENQQRNQQRGRQESGYDDQ